MSDQLVAGVLTPSRIDLDALDAALASCYDDVSIVIVDMPAQPTGETSDQQSSEPVHQQDSDTPDALDCLLAAAPLTDDVVATLGRGRAGDAAVPLVVLATPEQADTVREQRTAVGITDVVVAASADERRYQRLADRVRGAVQQRHWQAEQSASEGETADPGRAVRSLYEVATDADLSFSEKADRILEIGVDRLGVENAHLSTIDREPARYEVLASVGNLPIEPGELMDLPTTFCRRTVEREELLAISHASEQGWADDPAYERSGVDCYIGSRITVGGQLYGTVCFLDRDPHSEFTESEQTFVSLVARWLSHELERTRREDAFDVLHVATTELLGATSRTDACAVVGDAAESLVDASVVRVWLADGGSQTMRVLTSTDPELDGEIVRRKREEGEPLWQAVETGSVQYPTTLARRGDDGGRSERAEDGSASAGADAENSPEHHRSVLAVPLGREGVLEVAATARDAFDEIDVSTLRMLAASGAAALDRAERQEELEVARERFQRIFESANDALFLLDPMADEIVECNSRACDLLGYDRGDLLEVAPSTLYRQRADRYRSFLATIQSTGGGWTDGLLMQRRDGRRFPVEVSGAIVELPDQTCLLTSVRDITRRRLREQALAVFNRVLRHNIRNDMNVIVGQAELLARDLTDDSHQERVEEIRRMGEDLLSLGEKARLFQQIDDRDRETTTVDLQQTLTGVAESLHGEYPDGTIEIEGSAAMATVDPTIDIAFRELCENAVQHTDSPDPTVRVGITSLYDGEQVAVTVTDDGPGLSDQDRAVLEEGVETPLRHGSGLGLWIATWVVERSGGSISVPETGDGGTTIRVTLPTATEAGTESAGEAEEGEGFDVA
jgi:PAS domain S-box-containing protein